MAGTRDGGKKAAAVNLAKNPNFYAEIGRIGGAAKPSKPRGFAHTKIHDPKAFLEASAKGGQTSGRRRSERT